MIDEDGMNLGLQDYCGNRTVRSDIQECTDKHVNSDKLLEDFKIECTGQTNCTFNPTKYVIIEGVNLESRNDCHEEEAKMYLQFACDMDQNEQVN